MSVEINSVSIARTEVVLDGRGARGVNGTLTVSSASGQAVSSRVALAAIASPLNGQPALLTESGREGLFVFDTSNLLASVTADPGQGVYVAPASAPTGASGAWKRTAVGEILASWFGTVGDGVANDQPPIQQAITYAQGRGGGTVRLGPGTYKCTAALTWDAAPVALVGAGSSVQPNIGTILLFPTGLNGAVNPRNGAAGLGAGSAVRNLRIKGAGVSGVSDANAALGVGSGLLLQANGAAIDDVVCQGFEGHNCLIKSGYPGADVSINANNCHIGRLACYNGLKSGFATYGVDSNNGFFGLIDSANNADFGVYENALLGNVYADIHTSGNGTGSVRIGGISRANRMIVYKEVGTALTVQIDAGSGGGRNYIDLRQAEGDGGGTITVTDSSGAGDNIIVKNGRPNQGFFGPNQEILLNVDGLFAQNGAQVRVADNPLTAIWRFLCLTGAGYITSDQTVPFHIVNGAGECAAFDENGIDLPAGNVLKVASTQVVGPRRPAIPDLGGGATLADTITTLNAWLATARVHGLIAP